MQGMGDYFLRNSNTAGNACYVVINGKGGGIQLVQTWREVLALTSSNWVQFGVKSGVEASRANVQSEQGITEENRTFEDEAEGKETDATRSS